MDKVVMKKGDLPENPRLPILDRSVVSRAEVKKKPAGKLNGDLLPF